LRNLTYSEKKKFIKREKLLDNRHYTIIVILSILIIFYHTIKPKVIGHDLRYSLFILIIPTILGLLILGYYRRNFLKLELSVKNKAITIILRALFYLFQGLLFSFLIFGQLANISWNFVNRKFSEKQSIEVINCEITRFWKSSGKSGGNKVEFLFNNKNERIYIDNKTMNTYKNEDPNNYELQVYVREGIWNHYIVDDWIIMRKTKNGR